MEGLKELWCEESLFYLIFMMAFVVVVRFIQDGRLKMVAFVGVVVETLLTVLNL